MYYEGNNELYHHGILGQRWGKRNGPPYPLDPEDHSKKEKDSGWRKSLSAGSDSKKPSVKVKRKETKNTTINAFGKQVTITAQQKKAIGKYLAAGGAIILTTGAVYAGIKLTHEYRMRKYDVSKDWSIPSGTTLFRVEDKASDFQAGTHFYATVSKADTDVYNSVWGKRGADYVQREIKATAPLKIAGADSAKEVLKKFLAEDPEFYDWYKTYSTPSGEVTDKQLSRLLRNLPMDWLPNAAPQWKKVETELYKMGYRGLVDVNDSFSGGWFKTAYAPVVFFNSQESNYQLKRTNTILDTEKLSKRYGTMQAIRNTPWADIGRKAALATIATAGAATVAGLATPSIEEAIAKGWSSAAIAKKFKMSESQVVNIRDDLKQDKKK